MKDSIQVTVTSDTTKSLVVLVRGRVSTDCSALNRTIVDVRSIPRPRLKLESAWWLIQEKMLVSLTWGNGEVLFPMESRNSLRFPQFVSAPEDWGGKVLMDIDKIATCGTDAATFAFELNFNK